MKKVEPRGKGDWRDRLAELLPLFGHRNWIVVADSAYPAQSRDGIETIVAGAEQMVVVRAVYEAIGASNHARAHIYSDEELIFVREENAPGITQFKLALDHLFSNINRKVLPHEEIISKLDQAAQLFRVLVIKTRMTTPYTSVFFELDCCYWNAEAERRLREAMAQRGRISVL